MDEGIMRDELLTLAVGAAREAGRYLGAVKSCGGLRITEATRRDIKANADREVEEIIKAHLGAGLPILGEESGWSDAGAGSGDYWIVDGLDGTVNFLAGIPLACISIALVRGGRPHLGVVFDFLHDEMFAGAVGSGATLNGARIAVSATPDPAAALLLSAVATKRDFSSDAMAEFGAGLARWRKVRMLGSAAISLAYVAAGRADACALAGIFEWDVAAGLALVEAAGGAARAVPAGQPHVVDIYAHNGALGNFG
jgi:myo-inositol-1(or 4)-monophosphatase